MIVSGVSADDWDYIEATWVASFRAAHPTMPKSAYYPWQRERIAKIRDRDPCVVVARDTHDPLYIYGYGVFERFRDDFVAHWMYTRKTERRNQVGKTVLASAIVRAGLGSKRLVATHATYMSKKAGELGFVYVPLERFLRENKK